MPTWADRKVIYLALFAITVATAKASVCFHVGSRGANVHLSPITARNISSNTDALRPGAGRKNTFRPNARRPSRQRVLSPYHRGTRRRDRFAAERAIRDRLSQRLSRPVFIRAFTR